MQLDALGVDDFTRLDDLHCMDHWMSGHVGYMIPKNVYFELFGGLGLGYFSIATRKMRLNF